MANECLQGDFPAIGQDLEDDEALVRVVKETPLIIPMRILAYCLMPNHWHVLLWPERDWELSDFMHQMTTTHVRRWHKAHPSNRWGTRPSRSVQVLSRGK